MIEKHINLKKFFSCNYLKYNDTKNSPTYNLLHTFKHCNTEEGLFTLRCTTLRCSGPSLCF